MRLTMKNTAILLCGVPLLLASACTSSFSKVRAAINGELDTAETRQDPIFGLHVPVSVPGVDPKLLDPIQTWPDPAQFEETAKKLAAAFRENFEQYASMVSPEVVAAGPIA